MAWMHTWMVGAVGAFVVRGSPRAHCGKTTSRKGGGAMIGAASVWAVLPDYWTLKGSFCPAA
jgi:hypothetical protein